MNIISGFASLPILLQVAFAATYGAVFGSFLTMLSYRLPLMVVQSTLLPGEPGATPRVTLFQSSACPHCGHRIAPWYNIPVLGWVLSLGRCSNCRGAISLRYPIIEIVSLLAAVWCLVHFGARLEALWTFVFIWSLLLVAVIDFETMLIPDAVTLPLLWFGLLLAAVQAGPVHQSPAAAIFGAAGAYGILFVSSRAALVITSREMMGDGDLKLFAAVGAWLGWRSIPAVLFIASVTSVLAHIMAMVRAKRTGGAAPFGPWLALGACVMLAAPHAVRYAFGAVAD